VSTFPLAQTQAADLAELPFWKFLRKKPWSPCPGLLPFLALAAEPSRFSLASLRTPLHYGLSGSL
jgi:hypothetical protein